MKKYESTALNNQYIVTQWVNNPPTCPLCSEQLVVKIHKPTIYQTDYYIGYICPNSKLDCFNIYYYNSKYHFDIVLEQNNDFVWGILFENENEHADGIYFDHDLNDLSGLIKKIEIIKFYQ
jgi:hypothetical protein